MMQSEDFFYIFRFDIDGFGLVYYSETNDAEIGMFEAKRIEEEDVKKEYEKLQKQHPEIPIEILKIEVWNVDFESIN